MLGYGGIIPKIKPMIYLIFELLYLYIKRMFIVSLVSKTMNHYLSIRTKRFHVEHRCNWSLK